MKNRLLLVLLAIALVVSLVAFAACKAEEAPPIVEEEEEEAPPIVEEEEEEVWQWPDKLHFLASQAGTASYAFDMAYGVLLEDDTKMKVRVIGEDSLPLSYQWLKQSRFFWASMQTMHVKFMMEGIGEWASRDLGPWQMRMVWSAGTANFAGFAVQGDSGIRTPYDIKPGMKIGYLTVAGPAGKALMEALLAWAQIDPEDVVWIPASTLTMGLTHLLDGTADIIFQAPLDPGCLELEASPHGLGWIELNAEEDPEGATRFVELVPYIMPGVNMVGAPSAIGVHMFCDCPHKATHVDTDPDLVYQVVKWMDENYDRYKDKAPRLEGMDIDTLVWLSEHAFIPLHEGTIRYLKEKGLWTDAHEVRNQANIEKLTKWAEAYEAAIDEAGEKSIQVHPNDEDWIELWENYKKELDLPEFVVFAGLD